MNSFVAPLGQSILDFAEAINEENFHFISHVCSYHLTVDLTNDIVNTERLYKFEVEDGIICLIEGLAGQGIVNDLNMVEQLVSKMSGFDENIKEDEAEKLKGELEEIESYLLSQYKDYVDIDEKDIDLDSFKNDLDSKE